MFRKSLQMLLSGVVLATCAVIADSAHASNCPAGDGSAVANLAATGSASAPGLVTVNLNWQPTALGQGGLTGYIIFVMPPVFDYQLDQTVLNQSNPSDPLVINPIPGTGVGAWMISIPSGGTSASLPNLAPAVPYTFQVWTADGYAAFLQALFSGSFFEAGACAATAVSTGTAIYPPSTATVWGFADTHTHPFANDAYDQGKLLFYGGAFGPKDQVLTQDRSCPIGCPPDLPSWLHQGIITPSHLQNSGFNQPSAGWPDFDKYPAYNINLHQAMYSDWLYRAFLGGLKLIVAHAVNNELLCQVSSKLRASGDSGNCNDVAAVDRQISDARAMEQYLNAQCAAVNPPRCLGPNKGWFHIVTSPGEARSTINGGQLAVVLGIEVDRLFGCRASTQGNSDDRNHDCTQNDAPTQTYITQQVQKYYNLGVRHVFIAHLADSAFAGMAIYDSGIPVPWSANNLFVNGQDFQTEACIRAGYGFDYNQAQAAFALFSSSNPLGATLQFFGAVPTAGTYPVPTCNARGLQPLGRFLVATLRQNGILVDMDHLSLETWTGSNGLESQLTVVTEQDRRPYYFPTVAGHTGPTALGLGKASERGLNDEELTFLRRSYGLPAMGVEAGSASSHDKYTSAQNTSVVNNCDSSSSSFAQGYMYFMDSMGGPKIGAVAIASDQSLNKLVAPRFNLSSDPHSPWHTPSYSNGCDQNQTQAQAQTNPVTFVKGGLPLLANGPPSYYFAAAAGAGPSPPRVYLWTGERDYNMNAHRMWDFNADGLAHLGLYPEMIQDLQNVGVTPQEIAPLYNSAERYISMWQAYGSLTGNPDEDVPYQMGVIGSGAQGGAIFHDWQLATGGWQGGVPLGGMALQIVGTTNSDGRLEVFYIGTDNKIYHNWQTTPGGVWNGETALGGTGKQITVGKNKDGRLEVFYVGTNNAIYHNWQVSPGGSWNGEAALGGSAVQICVGADSDGHLEVFYIGTDSTIYHNWQNSPGGSWNGESTLGGSAQQITVGTNQDGHLEIFYVGIDEVIYHNWQVSYVFGTGWAGQNKLGGSGFQVEVETNMNGCLEVFYVGTNNAIYHNWQVSPGGSWNGEAALGGYARQLSAQRNGDGRLEVFYIGTNSAIYHNWQVAPASSWNGEALLESVATTTNQVFAAANGDGRLEVFYLGGS